MAIAMANEIQLTLLICCCNLPGLTFDCQTDIRLGIQRGKDVIDEVAGDAASVIFTATVRVARNGPHGGPNFLGPYAHGAVDDRFIYLSWSGVVDGNRAMFRRAKLRLRSIDWPLIDQSVATGRPVELTVNMTGKRGGPACATLESQGAQWSLAAPRVS